MHRGVHADCAQAVADHVTWSIHDEDHQRAADPTCPLCRDTPMGDEDAGRVGRAAPSDLQ